jgi:hypothetical protein
MFGPGQHLLRAARWWLTAALVIVAPLAPGFAAVADDRTNLPLKNWGGVSLYRDAVYDDLERLVTAGHGGRTPRPGELRGPARAAAGRPLPDGIHADE